MSGDDFWIQTAYALGVAEPRGNSIDARIREAERSHEGSMCMATCDECGHLIDTDDDPEACVDDRFLCPDCRENDDDESEELVP